MRRKLAVGTKIKFNIAQGLDVGVARIIDIDRDDEDGHLYYEVWCHFAIPQNIFPNLTYLSTKKLKYSRSVIILK